MATSRLTFAKFVELVVVLICLFAHCKTYDINVEHTKILTSGTYVGYTIILAGLAAGYLINTPINKRLDIFFSLVGVPLFLACAALTWKEYDDDSIHKVNNFLRETLNVDNTYKTFVYTKIGGSIVNAVLFLLDIVFTFRQ